VKTADLAHLVQHKVFTGNFVANQWLPDLCSAEGDSPFARVASYGETSRVGLLASQTQP
jgi:hypothetical protein